MELECYTLSDGKYLRCGYTTGSCAAAAAKAAAWMLCTGRTVETIEIDTPKGIRLNLEVEQAKLRNGFAICGIRKDGGDDIDATHGLLICARVWRKGEEGSIEIDGGEGIGRVTLAGLDQPIGAAAINRIPREMITREVREILRQTGNHFGVRIVIYAPEGVSVAAKTYNQRLGIVGGISILGTTGIVEPMSRTALMDTIRTELKVLRAMGNGPILITPGKYGETFSQEQLGLQTGRRALCSNFLGTTLDDVAAMGFSGILLVGHLGKLVKLAGGIYDTHSRTADARMEILTAHAAMEHAPYPLLEQLMAAPTTDAAVDLLKDTGLLKPVMGRIMERLAFHLRRRTNGIPAEAVVFSNLYGILGMTSGAQKMIYDFQMGEG